MERAFNEQISGRSPEKRGNGLKFVKNIVTAEPRRGIACRSGKGLADFGDYGSECIQVLRGTQQELGTITLLEWGLYENRT